MLTKYRGFSLVELMISILIGLIVLSAVSTIYMNTVRNNSDLLKVSKLNRELNAVMVFISNDIRRSGYWGGARIALDLPGDINLASTAVGAGSVDATATLMDFSSLSSTISANLLGPFLMNSCTAPPCGKMQINTFKSTNAVAGKITQAFTSNTLNVGAWFLVNQFTDITIADVATGAASAPGNCILYTYDRDADGALSDGTNATDERYGIRLNNNAIEIWTGSGAGEHICNGDAADWESITDTNITSITQLEFSLTNQSMTISGNSTLTVRDVVIELGAQLGDDPLTTKQLTETVRIRNDVFTP